MNYANLFDADKVHVSFRQNNKYVNNTKNEVLHYFSASVP